MENIDSYQELKKLDEQIESATELAALKPIYFRLNEIIQAFPGDFDVQFTGNEIKQRLMARGTVLKQQALSQLPPQPPPPVLAVPPEPAPQPPAPPEPAPPPPAVEVAPPPAPPPPAVEVAPPPAPPIPFLEAAPTEAVAVPEPAAPPEPVAAPEPAQPVAPEPTVETAPRPEYELPVMVAPSPSFPLFPLFAGAPPQPEPPAPPAYFADNVGPSPSPPGPAVMPAATLLALSYPSHDSVSAEQPLLALGVTSEPPPEPTPPAMPAVQPPPSPAPSQGAVPPAWPVAAPAPAPPAPPVPPDTAPFPLPTPLFDFSPPPLPPPPFAMGPANPPQPPAPPPPAMPAPQPLAPPPPLHAPFQDTFPPAPAVSPLAPAAAAATPPPLSSPLFDSAPAAAPPPVLPVTPEKPPQPPVRPPRPPRPPFNWKRPVVLAPIAGLLVVLAIVLLLVHQNRTRKAEIAARNVAAVQVDIATVPPGASVTVTPDKPAAGSGPATCTSNCRLPLTPGAYQISALLPGFDPAAGLLTVPAGKPWAISLTLQPQAQSVRLLTDLQQGKVVVDDHPPVDLQEGQLVLDKVAPGAHTLKVTGPNGEGSFSFEIADARLPAVTGPVNARNMVAVLVASFGKQARVVTNGGPWKLAVNGQPQSDASPAGADLTAFQPGVNDIVVGEGKDQRNMSETFGAAPMLTAFLKSDVNAGTLIVSTGQDGVHVFLNGKEDRRLTQHGQLRVPVLGKVTVRVTKSGFQEEPAQTAEVKKGAEVRLQFNLRPQPQFASLQIHGALAGTEILIDQKVAGTVGPDGLFSVGDIQPGEHNIELRREQHLPKRLQRAFQAGQAVVLAGADAVLASAIGTVRLTRNPASATVTYRRGEETEAHEVRGSQIELPAGTYTFAATAPGFLEFTARVQLAAGESREVDFALAREKAAAPAPVSNPMALFENPESWTKDGDSWVHKGGGFLLIKPAPKGVLTFTVSLVKGGGVFRGGAIRWCVQYVDPKNYLLSEVDRKNFWTGVVQNGKRLERVKAPHGLGNQKTFTIQIEIAPDRLVQKAQAGGEWKVLDSFAEPGRDYTQGKFGFLVQGNDEIAITDFKFLPR